MVSDSDTGMEGGGMEEESHDTSMSEGSSSSSYGAEEKGKEQLRQRGLQPRQKQADRAGDALR